eukprot:TRINITY_DN13913_c0_g1_i1.p1 TRINITY_DN13913_c0_g1~~TRINITY_DN13913_c0_g1_i1.p1  ORF type:complete len:499 (-),score=136.49 TRINITY_DN13913_c0_g1_i1:9-1505(-)
MSIAEFREKGTEEYKKGNYNEAIQFYTKALECDPNALTRDVEIALYGNRTAAYVMLEKWTEALRDAQIVIGKDPQNSKAYMRAAKAYLKKGDLLQAKEAYKKFYELDPNATMQETRLIDAIETMLNTVNSLIAEQKWEEAGRQLERILRECPESTKLKLLKGKILIGTKKYQEASTYVMDILQASADNPEALYLRGRALYYTGNFDGAIKHYQQALRLDPDNDLSRLELKKVRLLESTKKEGNDAFGSGNYEEAYRLYTKALEIDPTNETLNATLYCNRAAAGIKLKKLTESLEDCNKALALDEQYVKAYIRRAKIYMDLEQYEEAVRDYEKLNQMDPNNSEYRQSLRDAKLELKKSKRKDYYKILGIEKDAGETDIKKAYRKLALQWHPDKNSESEESKAKAEQMFKDISEAYSVLSDPKKKQRYDSGADLDEMGGGGMGEEDMNHIFEMFFGGGGGFGGGGFGGGPFGGSPFGGGGFGHGSPFGGGGGRRGKRHHH